MQLESEAETLVRVIGGVALALNLLGVGVLLRAARAWRQRPDDRKASGDSKAVLRGRRRERRAEGFADRLPWALAEKLPWSGMHRRETGAIELDNGLLSSPAIFLKQGAPLFDRAAVRWRAAGAAGLEVDYSLDHSHLARYSRRMAWILILFFSLPNVLGRAPLDFYVRLVQPDWSGYTQLVHLVHLFWPLLIWIIYKSSVSNARRRLETAIRTAAAGAEA